MRSVWLVVLLIGFAAGAQAQSFETNMNRCWNESADPDRQLSACTWLLNSGLLGPSEYPTTHLQRGNVYFSNRQYGRAIQDYGQAIALNSPLKKALLTGFLSTAKHNATKAVSPSSETMRTI